MTKQRNALKFRLPVIAVLTAFTAGGCYLLDLYEQPESEKVNPLPGYPVTDVPDQPAKTIEPVSFYLADSYDPAETDTGKTAFALAETSFPWDENPLPHFMAVSEEQETGTVVRFFDTGSGLAASVYFVGDRLFPDGFLLNRGEDGIARGTFSDYNKSAETFSLTLHYEEASRAFEKFVLNKNVFSVYQDDQNLLDGQNSRIRNSMTAMSVWTAMTIRFNAEREPDAENTPSESPDGAGSKSLSAGSEEGIQQAVENICLIGKPVETFLAAVYGKTADIAAAGTAISETMAAPPKIAVAVTEPILTAVTPSEDEELDGEDEEKRKAPRFTIYYYPDDGEKPEEKRSIPVLKEDEPPEIGQEFCIKPHDQSNGFTSSIRFYFEVAASEEIEVKTSRVFTSRAFSSRNYLYHPVNVKKEDGTCYFEVKKENGFIDDGTKTALTIKPYNGADPELPADFPYYYVNGREFAGQEGFVINFLDAPSRSEQDEVLTPKKCAAESPHVSNFVPFNPARYLLSDEAYFPICAPKGLPLEAA
jgi:hypothetical protein